MTLRTRRGALGILAGAGAACALPARLPAAARNVYDLAPRQVADGFWMIEGLTEYFSTENGGAIVNVALLETDAGMLVIDCGPSRRYGEALRAVCAQLTGRGVAEVWMTHQHPDHVFGTQAFADRPLRALPEAAAQIREHGDAYADAMYRLLGDWMRGTEAPPPEGDLAPGSVTLGGRRLELVPLSGHTVSDLAVMDVATGTLVAGDLAFLDRAPTTPDADLDAWRGALSAIDALAPAAVLPGHGPLDPAGRATAQTRAYLDWLEGELRASAEAGLDMVEVMARPIPPEFAAMGAMPQEFHRSVAHLFPAAELAVLPRADDRAD